VTSDLKPLYILRGIVLCQRGYGLAYIERSASAHGENHIGPRAPGRAHARSYGSMIGASKHLKRLRVCEHAPEPVNGFGHRPGLRALLPHDDQAIRRLRTVSSTQRFPDLGPIDALQQPSAEPNGARSAR